MAIMIDSAHIDEVRRAVALGFVRGCTTNPILMAKVSLSPRKVIEELCKIVSGPVFYQVTGRSLAEREKEARDFHAICPEKVVLKIPATTENIGLIARLAPEIPCAVTAVFSGYQTALACEAGARFVIPYVNRSTRLLGDGPKLVRELKEVIKALGAPVRILAASIKSPEEAELALLSGASDLTLPLDVLLALGNHKLSDEAIAEFDRALGC